jgi:hypothetical protein
MPAGPEQFPQITAGHPPPPNILLTIARDQFIIKSLRFTPVITAEGGAMTARIAKTAAVLFTAALAATTASANPGQGFTWSFQTTSLTSSSSSANVGAAMRNGLAWPVVVTDFSSSAPGASATLFPTGSSSGGSGSTNWQNIGTGFFNTSTVYHLRTASSPDGRVAFAASDSSGQGVGARVSSVGGGWGSLPAGTKAVAFDSHGTLYTATNNSVSGVGGYAGSTIVDMSVSPFGDVGVVSMDMKFWQYSSWLGNWTSATLTPSIPNTESADVEYDSFGRPHVLATFSSTLVAFDFNTVSGTWTSTVLASNVGSSSRATLAANADGTVGTAWIDSSGLLVYAFKHDLDNWGTDIVTSTGNTFAPSGQVGITYDYANLPVLAYRNNSTSAIMVAYDPVVVPEPAGLCLAGLAAAVLARRTRRQHA